MKILIIYESMFGNTRDVARAIADGLKPHGIVECVEVGNATDTVPAGIDLLIAGAPTHQFGLSRPSSRKQAQGQLDEPLVSTGRGIREWLETVTFAGTEPLFATFDTTMSSPRFLKYMGRASRQIEKRLKGKGLRPAAPAESFWVTSGNGPLADGEQERARSWAACLASTVAGEPAISVR